MSPFLDRIPPCRGPKPPLCVLKSPTLEGTTILRGENPPLGALSTFGVFLGLTRHQVGNLGPLGEISSCSFGLCPWKVVKSALRKICKTPGISGREKLQRGIKTQSCRDTGTDPTGLDHLSKPWICPAPTQNWNPGFLNWTPGSSLVKWKVFPGAKVYSGSK